MLTCLVLTSVAYAQEDIFDRLIEQGDKALADWTAKAEAGDIEAQVYLGSYYGKNAFLDQDWVASTKWYRRAAEQGHLDSQIYLAGLDRLMVHLMLMIVLQFR